MTRYRRRGFQIPWVRLMLWALGIGFLTWGFVAPLFRDGEGYLVTAFCLPLALAVTMAVWGWTFSTRVKESGFWFGLAVMGQGASLQLIEAGKSMSYQHYAPLARLAPQLRSLVFALLLIQAVLTILWIIPRMRLARRWVASRFSLSQLIGLGLIVVVFGATVSPSVSSFIGELALAGAVQTINLINIVLMITALPADASDQLNDRVESWLSGPAPRADWLRIDRIAMWAAIWVFIVAGALSYFVYERHPHIPDEVAYVYQAQFLAQGKLTMPAPPTKGAFDIYLMQFEGDQWYPVPPAGWPAMLAVGVILGLPWLVNPFLGALNIILAFKVVRELYDRRLARIAVLLLAVSPWYLFMAMNFMTHTFTLTAGLAAFLGVARARSTGKATWALIGGVGAGIASLIRPLDGLIIAIVAGSWAIGLWGNRLKLTALALFGAGVVLTGSLVFPYNQYLSGSFAEFPIMTYTDELFGKNSNAFGFGPDRGMGWAIDPFPGHSPLDALVNADLNLFSINFELFGWSTGSLLFVAIFLVSGRFVKSDWLMMVLFGTVFLFHFFYYFSGGPDFGARYWYLTILPFVVMTARGIGRASSGDFMRGHSGRIILLVITLSAIATTTMVPWRAIDKYHHYLEMRPDIRTMAHEFDFGRSLVLVRGDTHPDYASAMIFNPIDLYGDETLYAWDRSPEVRSELLNVVKDRPVWLVDGPSVTGSGFQVAAGPLSVDELKLSSLP